MNKRKSIFLSIAGSLLIFSCASNPEITVQLEESSEAFPNPLKGFRPSRYIQEDHFMKHEYASIFKHYIKYTDLETRKDDTVQKVVDWSNEHWKDVEKRNKKVIPRVVIWYPDGPDGGDAGYWPQGVPHNNSVEDWTSDILKSRLVAFIEKLGQAWDNDPRVAAVEVGLWGKWGEHHIYPDTLPQGGDRIPAVMQEAIGEACLKAFKNKKLMVRYPETFMDYEFGFIWDSFALPNDYSGGEGIMAREVWRTQMISGEVAYNWGDQSKLGGNPEGTLNNDTNTDHVIDWIYKTHNSSLGWIAEYKPENETILKNAARMQKAFGYRFVVLDAKFTTNIRNSLDIQFTVENKGAAPFYYHWPVEISLLNTDRIVIWKDVLDADIRKWLPGETMTVKGRFDVSELPLGTYILALAVLDPAGNKPALRFANSNYYQGGRTPIGKVGVGQDPDNQKLSPFDGIKQDVSLFYLVE